MSKVKLKVILRDRRNVFIFVLLLVLVLEGVLAFKYSEEKVVLERKVRKYRKRLQVSGRTVKKLKSLEREIGLYSKRVGRFSSEALGFAYLQSELSNLAGKYGVDMKNASVLSTKDWKYGIKVTSISFSVRGDVSSVYSFVSALEERSSEAPYVIKRASIRESAYKRGGKYVYTALAIFKVLLVWERGER